MLVIVPICDRIKLLPYFLKYYTSIGATEFQCALYNGEANPFYKTILSYRSDYNIYVRPSAFGDMDEYDGVLVAKTLNIIRMEMAQRFKWFCIADLDEFHHFRGRSMLEVISDAEARGYEAVHGLFHDRIASDGTFRDVEGMLDETFPLDCNLTRVYGGCPDKIALAKNYISIEGGHHGADNSKVWRHVVEVHHFKWIKGIQKILSHRYGREKKRNRPWADNISRLLNTLKNGIDLNDPKLVMQKARLLGV